jgi:pseudouridine kinase
MVFGGALVDQVASPINRQKRLILGSSNPGIMKNSYGGVGRNISEAVARAGVPVSLVSAVGDDGAGHGLLRHAEEHGVDVSRVKIVSPLSAASGEFVRVCETNLVHDSERNRLLPTSPNHGTLTLSSLQCKHLI